MSAATKRSWALCCALLTALTLAGVLLSPTAAATTGSKADPDDTRLYLVMLRGPGIGTLSGPIGVAEVPLLLQQDLVLHAVGSPEPVYRWTSALNGFAVELDRAQVRTLQGLPQVSRIEVNRIRPLAGVKSAAAQLPAAASDDAGAGTVIGTIDTGLTPGSPLFTSFESGAAPAGFTGTCALGADWSEHDCNGKVVGAQWFVDGFGAESISATSSLSPADTDGHGTSVASIAAGNSGIPVQAGGEDLGSFTGVAPAAHLAVYKACWNAPNPKHDGCATADLVTAIDAATSDGVDVLSLPVGGPSVFDTVEWALLGAAEAGIVVVAAAGNEKDSTSAHPGPWVITVGATRSDQRRGRVVLPDGRRLSGAMLSQHRTRRHRIVLAERAVSAGSSPAEARVCTPGSLDARKVAGRIVVCERGQVARVDKSFAVSLADGVGMILLNQGNGAVSADIHSVPSVHLGGDQAERFRRWAVRHPHGRVALEPRGLVHRRPRMARWSSRGDATGGSVKPDVVAAGTGVLGATDVAAWNFLTGTSAATAYTAGVAATLLARDNWTPTRVRSALITSARPVRRSALLASGAGLVDPTRARKSKLSVLVAPPSYRAWLTGQRRRLNTPSIVLTRGALRTRRVLTNTSNRIQQVSAATSGFRSAVTVSPASVVLEPGESAVFRIRASKVSRLDDGFIVWRDSHGRATRIPVVVGR